MWHTSTLNSGKNPSGERCVCVCVCVGGGGGVGVGGGSLAV